MSLFMSKNLLKLFKEQIIATAQLTKGLWLISKLSDSQTIVTIFGGTNLTQENKYAEQAHELGHMLSDNKTCTGTGEDPALCKRQTAVQKWGKERGFLVWGSALKVLKSEIHAPNFI